jgi:ABC-type transporter Mla subunit MlaD
MAEKLEFDLKVGSNELQKALTDATTGSKKLGDTISTALGTFAGNAALKGFSLLGDAIGSVGGFLKDSVKASQQQEDALNSLSQALRATGSFTEQALDDFDQFSDQLERTSLFAGDVVLSQVAVAKSFGATNQQAKDLVQAAANLAATFGGTLEENVGKLSKTLNGLVSKDLKAAIPELRSLSREAIESGEAIRLVNERFGGAAASQINTYTGQLNQLEDAFGKIQEEVGNVITQSELVKGAFQVVSSSLFGLVDALKTYQAQSKANQQGFVDTQSEIDSLSSKYASLNEEIEKQRAIISKEGPNKALVSAAEIQFAETRVKRLTEEAEGLFSVILQSQQKIASASTTTEGATGKKSLTEQELNQLRTLEAQKTQIVGNAELERQSIQAQIASESIQNEFVKQEAEIQRIAEFEAQKAELAFQFAEQKASQIENQALREAELAKIGKDRELEFTKIANKQLLAEEQLKNKKAQDSIAFFKKYEDQTNKERIQNLQSTFSTIATLSSSSNKTIAAIGKAAAISTATIDGYVAINKALASAPPPVNYALAAAVGAATAANVAKIAGVQGLATGGVVGATMGGDNRIATVRDGEMILNAEQQEKLFNMINAGGSGGDIVIQINEREIARAVRSQVQQGYRLA